MARSQQREATVSVRCYVVPAPVIIRRALPSDAPAMVSIALASPTSAQWPIETYQAAIASPSRLVLVAVADEEQIAGFVIAATSVPEWELENIAVLPSFRRRGIGRALMQALIEHARVAGVKEIRQEIRASNSAALSLGQAVGFTQEGRRRAYYQNPVEDALLFNYLLPDPE